jgi:hypothetical protein
MAFGVKRQEVQQWKTMVESGTIAYLTHYWVEPRFPTITTVTKVGCSDLSKLIHWCERFGLPPKYIHQRNDYPHFDLIGAKQKEILYHEQLWEQINRFGI